MRKLLFLPAILFALVTSAQKKPDPKKTPQKQTQQQQQQKQNKKYPSLLWEITGNGLKQPSYLFGTMHVSNKLAFHLGDSFFHAIKSVDVVALEQDPDLWQEEYSKQPEYSDFNFYTGNYFSFSGLPNDRLTINIFSFKDYKEKLKAALSLEAKLVNGMMYRRSPMLEDFQEDTYLDMYIYQAGKKLNKIVTGVENYKETNKLVIQAYKALMRDRYSKRKSYDYRNYLTEGKTREEAYRNGNLDLIDSLEQSDIISEEYQEKFMYKRNEIQAHSIDTILKKHSLFVAVGAAHLPGKRGVIELLRQKGYKVRPIIMGERNGTEKEKLEKIRVPVKFTEHWSEDSAFSFAAPGAKFFRYPSYGGLNMIQYADMANGSYYMITRIRTNASFAGHTQQFVINKIDSLLYENIPGKILEKKKTTMHGYPAMDVTNRTKKGDVQRYNIIVLPDEVVILKVAGVGDYVAETKEAGKFLLSIDFVGAAGSSTAYEPPYKGFAVQFPKKPFYIGSERNDRNRDEWTAVDDAGNAYIVMKTNLHQFDFIEEDTFDLGLLEESFASSSFIEKKLNRSFGKMNGYPALDALYEHSDGSKVRAKYILRGSDYFVIAARAKKPESLQPFFDSFRFTPYQYGEVKQRKDTTLGFTVRSSVFYPEKDTAEEEEDFNIYSLYRTWEDDEDYSSDDYAYYRSQLVANDTTGEQIYITRYTVPEYYNTKDTTEFFNEEFYGMSRDSSFIIYRKKETTDNKNWRILEYELRDTSSSRKIIGKNFYKNGTSFRLTHAGDTLLNEGSFVKTFFDTFEPADTFRSRDPFARKTSQFFNDYFGTDTVKSKKARNLIASAGFDSSDLPNIKKAIEALTWKNKKYLQTKKDWINVLGQLKDSASIQYLSQLYDNAKDTTDLQNAVLNALLDSKTAYSLETFKELVLKEPPAILEDGNYYNYRGNFITFSASPFRYRNWSGNAENSWGQLYDTLKLSSKIIPSLVNLMVVEDYKPIVMKLLVTAVDSGYLEGKAYKEYFSKFLLEGKQVLKKQLAEESQAAIEKESMKDNKNYAQLYYDDEDDERQGNEDLVDYATLLLPFWDENPEVKNYFSKLMTTTERKLLFDVSILLLRHHKPVHDSIILSLAANDNYRLLLYNALQEAKLLDKFPSRYKSQSDITRAIIIDRSNVDSLVFLKKELYTEKDQKGWIYVYKYKQMKDDDRWKIAVTGIQPFNPDSVRADYTYEQYNRRYGYFEYDLYSVSSSNLISDELFCDLTDEYYDENTNLSAVIAKIIKEKRYEKRRSTARFYSGKDSDIYDVYLPDRVRADRFD